MKSTFKEPFKVVVNGVTRRSGLTRDSAETIAETLWFQTGYHTQAVDAEGNISSEFES